MTTSQHDTELMTDAQLDAVPGGLFDYGYTRVTANRPPDIGAGTGRAEHVNQAALTMPRDSPFHNVSSPLGDAKLVS